MPGPRPCRSERNEGFHSSHEGRPVSRVRATRRGPLLFPGPVTESSPAGSPPRRATRVVAAYRMEGRAAELSPPRSPGWVDEGGVGGIPEEGSMGQRRIWLVLALLLVAIALPVGWYLLSPLFIERVVSEELPRALREAMAPERPGPPRLHGPGPGREEPGRCPVAEERDGGASGAPRGVCHHAVLQMSVTYLTRATEPDSVSLVSLLPRSSDARSSRWFKSLH